MDNITTVHHLEYEAEDYTGPTGTTAGRLGIWILISSEITIFAGLFGSYILVRLFHPEWVEESAHTNILLGTINTILLLTSNFFMMKATSCVEKDEQKTASKFMLLTIILGFSFLAVKGLEYAMEFSHGEFPSTGTFWSFYFLLTGLHGIHILGGLVAISILWAHAKNNDLGELKGRVALTGLYWSFVEVVWIFFVPPALSSKRRSGEMNITSSKSNHGLVYAALVVLALITVGASMLHLPGNENVYLIFALAFIQCLLVVIQYMGIKVEGIMVYGLVIIPLILFAILVFLCIPDISHYPLNLKL